MVRDINTKFLPVINFKSNPHFQSQFHLAPLICPAQQLGRQEYTKISVFANNQARYAKVVVTYFKEIERY